MSTASTPIENTGADALRSHPVLRLVAVPAILTLVVTGLRLLGELSGWSPSWFSTEPGGKGAVLGIGWLIPVFGAWFGWRLVREGRVPPSPGKAIALPLLGIVLLISVIAFVVRPLGVSQRTVALMLAATTLCSLLAVAGWPALARVIFVYALSARLPVVALTVVAVAANWGTHYEKPAPATPEVSDSVRTIILCAAQLFLWVPGTLLIGGFAGGIAAAITRKRVVGERV